MIRTTVKRSNQQNNATNTENTREGYFSHFDIIGANLFRGFRIFREGNNNNSSLENNNNNNLSLLLLPLGFGRELEEDLIHHLCYVFLYSTYS